MGEPATDELFPRLLTKQMQAGPACMPGIRYGKAGRRQIGQPFSICVSFLNNTRLKTRS